MLFGALVLTHVIAISNQVDRGGATLLQRWTLSVLSPLQALVVGAVRGVGALWSSYVDLRGVRQQNRQLAQRVGELEMELQQRRQQAEEATRLRELLEIKPLLPLQTMVALVIARDGTPWYRTITLDKGSRDGVALNAPVLSSTGVVGRVIKLGPRAARVQLLLDQQSGAGARIERSRITGIVAGQGRAGGGSGGDLTMKYVPMLADVVVGDAVVTSGLDRIYPPGLLIGRVRVVKPTGAGLFKEILIAPSARFDSLEEVMVVTSTLPDDTTPQSVR
jgi:rod shape-determining protein MreC